EIEGAIDDVGAAEPGVAVAIPHAQDRHRGQMPTRRLAAYRQSLGAELPLAVLYQPGGSSLAIVRTRWIRVFRRQPVFDSDNSLTRIVGDPLQHRILHV